MGIWSVEVEGTAQHLPVHRTPSAAGNYRISTAEVSKPGLQRGCKTSDKGRVTQFCLLSSLSPSYLHPQPRSWDPWSLPKKLHSQLPSGSQSPVPKTLPKLSFSSWEREREGGALPPATGFKDMARAHNRAIIRWALNGWRKPDPSFSSGTQLKS